MSMYKLNDKQKLFCKYYTDTLNEKTFQNGTQSAIAAGYSSHTAASQGSRLLKDVNAIEFMAFLKTDIEELFQQEAKTMLGVLMEVATSKASKDAARVSAAKDILDRAGYNPTLKVKGEIQQNISGSVTTSKEIHIIQEVINSNEDVADAILQAMKRNRAVTPVTEEQTK